MVSAQKNESPCCCGHYVQGGHSGVCNPPSGCCGFFGTWGLVRGLRQSQAGTSTRADRVHGAATGLGGDCSKRTPRTPHRNMAAVPRCMLMVPGRREGLMVSDLLISQKMGILEFWFYICLRCRRPGFHSWFGKIPWRSEWQPTPVFLPGKFHGQRSLGGYSPCGGKESDTV